MQEHHLNIVSFTVPFPANYGGVLDVFYKLTSLKASGIRVHLHCFEYDRRPAFELNGYCDSVHYYRRNKGFKEQLSWKPYIVKGRRSEDLLNNLLSNDYPILFEGLHSCFYMDHPALKGRKLIYRESNIEHQYYFNLFRSEKKLSSRAYFLLESIKLHHYQKVLKNANLMLVVSEKDQDYLKNKFPGKNVVYLPSFHGNNQIKSKAGRGSYAFYHGNLSVVENSAAAEFLVREVFEGLDVPLLIAGMRPPEQLRQLAASKGISLLEDPTNEQMDQLIQDAHVNILVTFQATGLKLKLLNALFKGRFLVANHSMLSGTGLDSLCNLADSASELKTTLKTLFTQEFTQAMIDERKSILMTRYSDEINAKKLVDLIF